MGQFLTPIDRAALSNKGFFGARVIVASGPPPELQWTAQTPADNVPLGAAGSPGTVVYFDTATVPHWSTDAGVTFNASVDTLGTSDNSGGVNPVCFESGNFVTAGSLDGGVHVAMFYSSDGGQTWTQATVVNTVTTGVACIVGNSSGHLFMGLNGTLAGGNYFTSADKGVTWVQRNTFATATAWGATNTDRGATWDGNEYVSLALLTDSHYHVLSSGDGVTWADAADLGNVTASGIAFGNSLYCVGLFTAGVVFAGTLAGLASATPTLPSGFSQVDCLIYDGSRFLIFGSNGFVNPGLVVSTTDGVTFTDESLNFTANDFASFAAVDNTHGAVVAFAGQFSPNPPFGTRKSIATREPL